MDKIVNKQTNNIIGRTKEQFVKEFSPLNCLIKYKNCKSIENVYRINSPSLAIVKKNYSENFVHSYISIWIIQLNEFLNLPRKLNAEQIKEISILIYSEYYFFKIADFHLVFKRIKLGFYGQFYEGIDGMKILTMIEKYATERVNYFINETENVNYNEDIERTNNPDKMKARIFQLNAAFNYDQAMNKKNDCSEYS